MPLTELMNYFNDQLKPQARSQSLPATGFYKVGNSYGARFGSLTFSSRFSEIKRPFEQSNIVGHHADLLVRTVTGKKSTINEVAQSLDSADQIIHLDRLTRTLHSLNYLQGYDNKALLSLAVQSRHILSVTAEHGKTFEGILSDCGLEPERVLLHTRLLDLATLPHFRNAFIGYRSRGYKIGIDIWHEGDLTLLKQLALAPEFILYHLPSIASHTALPGQNFPSTWPASFRFFNDAKSILIDPDQVLLDKLEIPNFYGYISTTEASDNFDRRRSLA